MSRVWRKDLLGLHGCGQLVKSRTALCNQLRGLLRERGVWCGPERRRLSVACVALADDS